MKNTAFIPNTTVFLGTRLPNWLDIIFYIPFGCLPDIFAHTVYMRWNVCYYAWNQTFLLLKILSSTVISLTVFEPL